MAFGCFINMQSAAQRLNEKISNSATISTPHSVRVPG